MLFSTSMPQHLKALFTPLQLINLDILCFHISIKLSSNIYRFKALFYKLQHKSDAQIDAPLIIIPNYPFCILLLEAHIAARFWMHNFIVDFTSGSFHGICRHSEKCGETAAFSFEGEEMMILYFSDWMYSSCSILLLSLCCTAPGLCFCFCTNENILLTCNLPISGNKMLLC